MLVNLVADTAQAKEQRLAALQTDKAGYVSFKLNPSTLDAIQKLKVVWPGVTGGGYALDTAQLASNVGALTIMVEDAAAELQIVSNGQPSIMSPDEIDYGLSPGSIGFTPMLSGSAGLCGQIMPTTLAVRRFSAFQIHADICKPETLQCGNLAAIGRDGATQPVQIVRGRLLEYEIVWNPAGTSLGELLNSISLAPCEQVNVAIVDWTRREITSLDQSASMQQQSTQQMDHNRLVTESMQSAIKNKALTGSVASTSGAAMSIPQINLDLTSTFGWGAAGSISSQTVAANTTSQLSERVVQSASFVASQRSSAVYQTTASEQQTYQTRTIRNNNHCHTLTIAYYQINRTYNVVTRYKGARDVILVKYPNSDFDAQRAY